MQAILLELQHCGLRGFLNVTIEGEMDAEI